MTYPIDWIDAVSKGISTSALQRMKRRKLGWKIAELIAISIVTFFCVLGIGLVAYIVI